MVLNLSLSNQPTKWQALISPKTARFVTSGDSSKSLHYQLHFLMYLCHCFLTHFLNIILKYSIVRKSVQDISVWQSSKKFQCGEVFWLTSSD
jgi:hypothetical protein